MYDPFAPPQLPQQVQGQTVGMVPGVPGSMGTNPAAGGPVMTPGGGGTGAPVMAGSPQGPSPNNALGTFMQDPQFQALMNGPQGQALLQAYPHLNRYFSPGGGQSMQDWRLQRPDHQTYTGADWRSTIQDWRAQRPGMASPAPTGMFPPQPAPAPIVSADPTSPFAGPPVNAPRSGRTSPRGGAGSGYGF